MLTEQDIQALKRFVHLGLQQAIQQPDGMQAAALAVVLTQKLDTMQAQQAQQAQQPQRSPTPTSNVQAMRPVHLPPKPNGSIDAQTGPDQIDG